MSARFVAQYGPVSAAALAAAILVPGPVTVRRNRRLCFSAGALIDALAAEGVEAVALARVVGARGPRALSAGAPDALTLAAGRPRCGIFGLEAYHQGLFEVQDAGSQCIAQAVAEAVRTMEAAENGRVHGEGGARSGDDAAASSSSGVHAGEPRGGKVPGGQRRRVWRILDMCSGNGGKAIAIASALSGDVEGTSTNEGEGEASVGDDSVEGNGVTCNPKP